jgi:diguanylate cyclase (GGDEF)-like protein
MQTSAGGWHAEAGWAFPRLPPGRYRFRVWARDAEGVESGPVEHAFTVVAPAWRRPWALAAYALALLVLGLAAGRMRHHWLAQRAATLAREVAERTAELGEANRRLAEAATTDPLTGLHNRRRVDDLLPLPGARLLVLLDIDRFKQVNDVYGHAAGDAVLVAVARRLRQVLRAGDAVLRWGGEEFLLLCAAGDAHATLQRVLGSAAGGVALDDGRVVEVTASAGAIQVPAATGADTIDAWVALADGALYRAKSEGRDRGVLLGWSGDSRRPRDLATEARIVPRAP